MHYDLSIPWHLTLALGPDLLLMAGAMVLALFAAWAPESASRQRAVGWGSIVLVVLTMGVVLLYWSREPTSNAGIIAVDAFRWTADLVFLLGTLLALLFAIDYNDRAGITTGESHVLILFATSGMMLLAGARDLMIVFLGIELMSIATYVLAGLNRRSARAAESSLKYFLLGAFSTGFLLYGIALTYGATGSTNLGVIGERVILYQLGANGLLIAGIALLIIGFCFKVAAAPFHMWAPDVYEGAPTPTTAYMAAVVKAAAFVSFLRIMVEAFPTLLVTWHSAIWYLAVITMIVGNLVALAQRSLKRVLAYSSIAHAGYLLVTIAVAGIFPEDGRSGAVLGTSAMLFYLLAYTLATMGAFAVITAASTDVEANPHVDDLSGLWLVRPGLAVAMSIFMLALLGFPLFGGIGFFAKWYLLRAALDAPSPQIYAAIAIVLTSVISAGYYLRIVMVMFMRPRNEGALTPVRAGFATRTVIVGTAVLIIALGIWPPALDAFFRSERLVQRPPPTLLGTRPLPAAVGGPAGAP
jgi:NADH-quinone oxidoreductase subunit N